MTIVYETGSVSVRQFGDWLDVSDAPVEFTHVRPGETLLKEAAE